MKGTDHLRSRAKTAEWLYAGERVCPRCGVRKPVEEFTADRAQLSGRGSRCRYCDRQRSRAYYAANREACGRVPRLDEGRRRSGSVRSARSRSRAASG